MGASVDRTKMESVVAKLIDKLPRCWHDSSGCRKPATQRPDDEYSDDLVCDDCTTGHEKYVDLYYAPALREIVAMLEASGVLDAPSPCSHCVPHAEEPPRCPRCKEPLTHTVEKPRRPKPDDFFCTNCHWKASA